MTDFFRFPSIPHLFPPQGVDVRADKVLSDAERVVFLQSRVYVEEKVDGENLGISGGEDGLLFQARGSYVEPGGRHFQGLESWAAPRHRGLLDALGRDLTLFGEWCAVTHSVRYTQLPDWFLVLDVVDRRTGVFWPVELRDEFAADLGLHVVASLAAGTFEQDELTQLIGPSTYGVEAMEGVVVRAIDERPGPRRAKVVRPHFVQQIAQHWATGEQRRNRLVLTS